MPKTPAEILAVRRAELAARIEECAVRTEETLKNTSDALKRSRTIMAAVDQTVRQNEDTLGRVMRDHGRLPRKAETPKR